jgi:hypothetical protein
MQDTYLTKKKTNLIKSRTYSFKKKQITFQMSVDHALKDHTKLIKIRSSYLKNEWNVRENKMNNY